MSDQTIAVHSQVPAAYLQQVFGEIDPMLAQESMIAQPAAILNTDLNEQTSVSGQDKAMLQPLDGLQGDPSLEMLQPAGQAHHNELGGLDDADLAASREQVFAKEGNDWLF